MILRKQISEKLWELHRGGISCMLAGVSSESSRFYKQRTLLKQMGCRMQIR